MQEITGVEPKFSEDLVQKMYATYAEIGWFSDLKRLQEITGIEPKFSEDLVQEIYATYAERGWFSGLKELQEITGIEPDQNVYKRLIKDLYKTL